MVSAKKICYIAVLTALTVVLSSFSIPVPGGHLYLNDTVICFAALAFDPFSAFIVGGIGAFLGDFFFYPAPMFVSLAAHGLQAIAISLIAGGMRKFSDNGEGKDGLKNKNVPPFWRVILALLTLANHLPEIAGLEEYAFNSDLAILCIFVISPFADSIAYVFGRFLKKKFPKKMAPHVSPNKTVIGGIGGLVGGLTGAAILYFSYNAVAGSFDKMQLFLPVYLLIGLVTAAATEFGDLVESCVKRKAGIKDMGKLLPGHGGIMDRIDGTLFAAMTVYLVFALFALIMRA